MKSTSLILACAFLSAAALTAHGQTPAATKTITYGSGTVTEYVPGTTFIVNEPAGPVNYRYGKQVVYVNKHGKIIAKEKLLSRIKAGTPVQVYYDQDGDARVVNRVIVNDE